MDHRLGLVMELAVYVSGKEAYRNAADPFVSQLIDYCYILHSGMSSPGLKDTGGTVQSIGSSSRMEVNAPAGNVNYGIVVGTSQSAVSLSDFKLGSRIAHGTGSGQLIYSQCTLSVNISVGTLYRVLGIDRVFTNGSGAQITVYEIGLYGMGTGPLYFCLARDVVAGGVAVPNGEAMAVQYRWTTTV